MNVTNCRSCGRLFNVLGSEKICPSCQQALEEKFQQVKDYLRKNPNASVEETATENDVTTKQIKQWVKEERLILIAAADLGLTCETCGRPIRVGRLCDKCKAALVDEMEGAVERPQLKEEPVKKRRDANRMHFLQS